ncbi:hypothetical protein Vretimale_17920 [Volvox reticuliferus]|nr:hypothetical protein Vretimale_17920 [Volvox reticuliferus]
MSSNRIPAQTGTFGPPPWASPSSLPTMQPTLAATLQLPPWSSLTGKSPPKVTANDGEAVTADDDLFAGLEVDPHVPAFPANLAPPPQPSPPWSVPASRSELEKDLETGEAMPAPLPTQQQVLGKPCGAAVFPGTEQQQQPMVLLSPLLDDEGRLLGDATSAASASLQSGSVTVLPAAGPASTAGRDSAVDLSELLTIALPVADARATGRAPFLPQQLGSLGAGGAGAGYDSALRCADVVGSVARFTDTGSAVNVPNTAPRKGTTPVSRTGLLGYGMEELVRVAMNAGPAPENTHAATSSSVIAATPSPSVQPPVAGSLAVVPLSTPLAPSSPATVGRLGYAEAANFITDESEARTAPIPLSPATIAVNRVLSDLLTEVAESVEAPADLAAQQQQLPTQGSAAVPLLDEGMQTAAGVAVAGLELTPAASVLPVTVSSSAAAGDAEDEWGELEWIAPAASEAEDGGDAEADVGRGSAAIAPGPGAQAAVAVEGDQAEMVAVEAASSGSVAQEQVFGGAEANEEWSGIKCPAAGASSPGPGSCLRERVQDQAAVHTAYVGLALEGVVGAAESAVAVSTKRLASVSEVAGASGDGHHAQVVSTEWGDTSRWMDGVAEAAEAGAGSIAAGPSAAAPGKLLPTDVAAPVAAAAAAAAMDPWSDCAAAQQVRDEVSLLPSPMLPGSSDGGGTADGDNLEPEVEGAVVPLEIFPIAQAASGEMHHEGPRKTELHREAAKVRGGRAHAGAHLGPFTLLDHGDAEDGQAAGVQPGSEASDSMSEMEPVEAGTEGGDNNSAPGDQLKHPVEQASVAEGGVAQGFAAEPMLTSASASTEPSPDTGIDQVLGAEAPPGTEAASAEAVTARAPDSQGDEAADKASVRKAVSAAASQLSGEVAQAATPGEPSVVTAAEFTSGRTGNSSGAAASMATELEQDTEVVSQVGLASDAGMTAGLYLERESNISTEASTAPMAGTVLPWLGVATTLPVNAPGPYDGDGAFVTVESREGSGPGMRIIVRSLRTAETAIEVLPGGEPDSHVGDAEGPSNVHIQSEAAQPAEVATVGTTEAQTPLALVSIALSDNMILALAETNNGLTAPAYVTGAEVATAGLEAAANALEQAKAVAEDVAACGAEAAITGLEAAALPSCVAESWAPGVSRDADTDADAEYLASVLCADVEVSSAGSGSEFDTLDCTANPALLPGPEDNHVTAADLARQTDDADVVPVLEAQAEEAAVAKSVSAVDKDAAEESSVSLEGEAVVGCAALVSPPPADEMAPKLQEGAAAMWMANEEVVVVGAPVENPAQTEPKDEMVDSLPYDAAQQPPAVDEAQKPTWRRETAAPQLLLPDGGPVVGGESAAQLEGEWPTLPACTMEALPVAATTTTASVSTASEARAPPIAAAASGMRFDLSGWLSGGDGFGTAAAAPAAPPPPAARAGSSHDTFMHFMDLDPSPPPPPPPPQPPPEPMSVVPPAALSQHLTGAFRDLQLVFGEPDPEPAAVGAAPIAGPAPTAASDPEHAKVTAVFGAHLTHATNSHEEASSAVTGAEAEVAISAATSLQASAASTYAPSTLQPGEAAPTAAHARVMPLGPLAAPTPAVAAPEVAAVLAPPRSLPSSAQQPLQPPSASAAALSPPVLIDTVTRSSGLEEDGEVPYHDLGDEEDDRLDLSDLLLVDTEHVTPLSGPFAPPPQHATAAVVPAAAASHVTSGTVAAAPAAAEVAAAAGGATTSVPQVARLAPRTPPTPSPPAAVPSGMPATAAMATVAAVVAGAVAPTDLEADATPVGNDGVDGVTAGGGVWDTDVGGVDVGDAGELLEDLEQRLPAHEVALLRAEKAEAALLSGPSNLADVLLGGDSLGSGRTPAALMLSNTYLPTSKSATAVALPPQEAPASRLRTGNAQPQPQPHQAPIFSGSDAGSALLDPLAGLTALLADAAQDWNPSGRPDASGAMVGGSVALRLEELHTVLPDITQHWLTSGRPRVVTISNAIMAVGTSLGAALVFQLPAASGGATAAGGGGGEGGLGSPQHQRHQQGTSQGGAAMQGAHDHTDQLHYSSSAGGGVGALSLPPYGQGGGGGLGSSATGPGSSSSGGVIVVVGEPRSEAEAVTALALSVVTGPGDPLWLLVGHASGVVTTWDLQRRPPKQVAVIAGQHDLPVVHVSFFPGRGASMALSVDRRGNLLLHTFTHIVLKTAVASRVVLGGNMGSISSVVHLTPFFASMSISTSAAQQTAQPSAVTDATAAAQPAPQPPAVAGGSTASTGTGTAALSPLGARVGDGMVALCTMTGCHIGRFKPSGELIPLYSIPRPASVVPSPFIPCAAWLPHQRRSARPPSVVVAAPDAAGGSTAATTTVVSAVLAVGWHDEVLFVDVPLVGDHNSAQPAQPSQPSPSSPPLEAASSVSSPSGAAAPLPLPSSQAGQQKATLLPSQASQQQTGQARRSFLRAAAAFTGAARGAATAAVAAAANAAAAATAATSTALAAAANTAATLDAQTAAALAQRLPLAVTRVWNATSATQAAESRSKPGIGNEDVAVRVVGLHWYDSDALGVVLLLGLSMRLVVVDFELVVREQIDCIDTPYISGLMPPAPRGGAPTAPDTLAGSGARVVLLGSSSTLYCSRLLTWQERLQTLAAIGKWKLGLRFALDFYKLYLARVAAATAPAASPSARAGAAVDSTYHTALRGWMASLAVGFVKSALGTALRVATAQGLTQMQLDQLPVEVVRQLREATAASVLACLAAGREQLLFDTVFPLCRDAGAAGPLVEAVEVAVLAGSLPRPAPELVQALVDHLAGGLGRPDRVERCVLHFDITSLDLDQVCVRTRVCGLSCI